MAMKIAGSAVSITSGRGAARVQLIVSFKELDAWARRMKIEEEKLWKRSYMRACKGLKDKFLKVVKHCGGESGVPKFKDFEAFTLTLREASGKSGRPMGGQLAERWSVYGGQSGAWYYVGWKDYLKTTAEHFQDGYGGHDAEIYFTDPAYRRAWHRRGIREIPYAYVHNERRILPEPFGAFVKKHLDEWAQGAYYKELARQMQKGARAA